MINFYIVCDPNDTKIKEKVLTLYNNKYKPEIIEQVLDNIKFISRLDCYSLKLDKVLFLDVKSYNEIYWLNPNGIKYLYCNNTKDMKLGIPYPITTIYGYYDYQKFFKRTRLKLKFDIFKELQSDIKNNKTYVSSLSSTVNDIRAFLPPDYIFKTHTQNLNIYDTVNNILYVHNGALDTNNRLIPEAKFYKKNLNVIFVKDEYKNDSIYDRYTSNDLNEYWLTENDILIKDFLND
jgi:hypothetical protein